MARTRLSKRSSGHSEGRLNEAFRLILTLVIGGEAVPWGNKRNLAQERPRRSELRMN